LERKPRRQNILDRKIANVTWFQTAYNLVSIRKTNYMSLFVFFISLLIVAQHVSGNHVPIIRNWRLRDVIALCWYLPWLQEGGQIRLVDSASIGRTTYQPVLTTFLQPRHIPTQGYNITQLSAPDDGHMIARNMLSNY